MKRGRPKGSTSTTRRLPVCIKLPPHLVAWLRQQPSGITATIEALLTCAASYIEGDTMDNTHDPVAILLQYCDLDALHESLDFVHGEFGLAAIELRSLLPIAQVLVDAGEFAHGGRSELARWSRDWHERGFTADEVSSWLQSGTYAAEAAEAMRAIQLSPHEAALKWHDYEPDGDWSRFTIPVPALSLTLGHAVSERELTAYEVAALIEHRATFDATTVARIVLAQGDADITADGVRQLLWPDGSDLPTRVELRAADEVLEAIERLRQS